MPQGWGPGSFVQHTELGDRSVWTDTPAEKARKATAAREREQVQRNTIYVTVT